MLFGPDTFLPFHNNLSPVQVHQFKVIHIAWGSPLVANHFISLQNVNFVPENIYCKPGLAPLISHLRLLKKIHNVVSSLPVDDRGSRWAELQCLLQNFQNETENGAAHIGAIITNPTKYHGKGRPKQKRVKGSQEVKYSSTKCSKCGQIGHNKRTCTTY